MPKTEIERLRDEVVRRKQAEADLAALREACIIHTTTGHPWKCRLCGGHTESKDAPIDHVGSCILSPDAATEPTQEE